LKEKRCKPAMRRDETGRATDGKHQVGTERDCLPRSFTFNVVPLTAALFFSTFAPQCSGTLAELGLAVAELQLRRAVKPPTPSPNTPVPCSTIKCVISSSGM
jgi:hypothetical protein